MRWLLVFLLLVACAAPQTAPAPGAVYRVPQDAEACEADPGMPWCEAECRLRDREWCK